MNLREVTIFPFPWLRQAILLRNGELTFISLGCFLVYTSGTDLRGVQFSYN